MYMPKTTLLAKAKASVKSLSRVRSNRLDAKYPADEIEELVLAYLKNEIRFTDFSRATGFKGSSIYGLIVPTIRRLISEGRIKIV